MEDVSSMRAAWLQMHAMRIEILMMHQTRRRDTRDAHTAWSCGRWEETVMLAHAFQDVLDGGLVRAQLSCSTVNASESTMSYLQQQEKGKMHADDQSCFGVGIDPR